MINEALKDIIFGMQDIIFGMQDSARYWQGVKARNPTYYMARNTFILLYVFAIFIISRSF